MRKLLLLLTLLSITSTFAQDIALASCCETKPATEVPEARCTGSMSCRACTNCSRCAHCGAGGTCGVCATYTPPAKKYKAKSKTKAKATSKGTAKKKSSYKSKANTKQTEEDYSTEPDRYNTSSYEDNDKVYKHHQMLEVIAECSLRGGTEFTVIEKLQVGQMLTYISKSNDGEWLEVRVNESGKTGFVFKQFVK